MCIVFHTSLDGGVFYVNDYEKLIFLSASVFTILYSNLVESCVPNTEFLTFDLKNVYKRNYLIFHRKSAMVIWQELPFFIHLLVFIFKISLKILCIRIWPCSWWIFFMAGSDAKLKDAMSLSSYTVVEIRLEYYRSSVSSKWKQEARGTNISLRKQNKRSLKSLNRSICYK